MDLKGYLGKEVEVVIDRPLGSKHPEHGFEYPVNYGYVPNTKAPDGEETDAYYLGEEKPVKRAKGNCIGIVKRKDDDDDKLIVVKKGKEYSKKEIEKLISFQEKWFDSEVI